MRACARAGTATFGITLHNLARAGRLVALAGVYTRDLSDECGGEQLQRVFGVCVCVCGTVIAISMAAHTHTHRHTPTGGNVVQLNVEHMPHTHARYTFVDIRTRQKGRASCAIFRKISDNICKWFIVFPSAAVAVSRLYCYALRM